MMGLSVRMEIAGNDVDAVLVRDQSKKIVAYLGNINRTEPF